MRRTEIGKTHQLANFTYVDYSSEHHERKNE